MRQCHFFIWTLIIFIPIMVSAQPDGADILKNVQKTYRGVHALKADFEQLLAIKLTDDRQESSGNLILERPDRFRLMYEKPESQLLISNGQKVWFYDRQMEQVIIRDAGIIDPTLNPLYFLEHVEDDFRTQVMGEEKIDGTDCFHLQLAKKDTTATDGLNEMEIWVSKEKWLVHQFRVHNNNQDFTTYTLKKIKLNPDLKSDDFEFKVPQGTEVIDETTGKQ